MRALRSRAERERRCIGERIFEGEDLVILVVGDRLMGLGVVWPLASYLTTALVSYRLMPVTISPREYSPNVTNWSACSDSRICREYSYSRMAMVGVRSTRCKHEAESEHSQKANWSSGPLKK